MTLLRTCAVVWGIAGLASVVALTLEVPAASANVYWANSSGNSIGRADGDGTAPDQNFILGATAPRGVAVDGSHVYWAHAAGSGAIGRANLDGTGADQFFISTGGNPQGVATDNAGVYWTSAASGAGKIGRTPLTGSPINPGFVATGPAPCGVAVDADKVYWANSGDPGSIGRSHGAFTATQNFIDATHDPCGVAVTDRHVYWTNRATNSIGRADLDGTNANENFLPATAPCGVAADGSHIYWSNANDTIGRANLDGTAINQEWVTGAQGPCGVTVDPTVSPMSAAYSYSKTATGRNSAIKAFVLNNTSSSTLGVSSITLVGKNRADFRKTGDSCVSNGTPAGGACVFNVRFTPRVPGLRRAALRVTSNASNSPGLIPLAGVGIDRTRPRITSVAIRPDVLAASRRDLAGTRRATGARFRYVLSEASRVKFSIQRCQRPTPVNRRQLACLRWAGVGSYTRTSHIGFNTKHVVGHLRGRALRPGRYRAVLVAADAAGNISRPHAVGFHIVP